MAKTMSLAAGMSTIPSNGLVRLGLLVRFPSPSPPSFPFAELTLLLDARPKDSRRPLRLLPPRQHRLRNLEQNLPTQGVPPHRRTRGCLAREQEGEVQLYDCHVSALGEFSALLSEEEEEEK